MKKLIIGSTIGIFQVLLSASGAFAAGNLLSTGYRVKMHPEGHIALFMKKPLVYTNPHIWAAYLLVMIALGLAALILLYKQKDKELSLQHESGEQAQSVSVADLNQRQEELLQRIKHLDQQFKSGEIDEQNYREAREKTKELLVQVKLQLKELS